MRSSNENSTAYKEHCPILERPVRGYTLEQLLDIIVENSSKCFRVPRGVREHATYGSNIELPGQFGITSITRYHSNDGVSPDPEGVYTLYQNYCFQHSHTDPCLLVVENLPKSAGKKGAPRKGKGKGKAPKTRQPLMSLGTASLTTSTTIDSASAGSSRAASTSATSVSSFSVGEPSKSKAFATTVETTAALMALSGGGQSSDSIFGSWQACR